LLVGLKFPAYVQINEYSGNVYLFAADRASHPPSLLTQEQVVPLYWWAAKLRRAVAVLGALNKQTPHFQVSLSLSHRQHGNLYWF
jgi:hypothetical protein